MTRYVRLTDARDGRPLHVPVGTFMFSPAAAGIDHEAGSHLYSLTSGVRLVTVLETAEELVKLLGMRP